MSYFGTATSYLCTVKHYKRTENINHYGRITVLGNKFQTILELLKK